MKTLEKLIVLPTVFISIALFLSSCMMYPQPRREVFSVRELAPYAETGTSTVVGQAFLKTMSGDVKFGAGEEVMLVPVTLYTTEYYKRAVVNGEQLHSGDSRLHDYVRTTIADGHGNFEFHNIPAGEYYLACRIEWKYVSRTTKWGAYTSTTGGIAHAKVKVEEGDIAKVIVTRQ